MASKTKIYLALIVVGLIVLAVDRFHFGASAPATVAANPVDPAADEEGEKHKPARHAHPVVKPAGPSKLSVPELHFPRSLPTYDPAFEMRDVFTRINPDDAAPSAGHPTKSGSAGKNAEEGAIGREAFQATHRIDAVMVQESLKIAVVDGRWLRVGDAVDTCTLTRIEGDSVVFECHDGGTVLSPPGKRRPPRG